MSESKVPCWIRWNQPFPDPCEWPSDDLVVVGGTLSASRLIDAYSSGMFPMFDDDEQAVLWWSPDPRSVLAPRSLRRSRSLRRRLRSGDYQIKVNTSFEQVIAECAKERPASRGTWITPSMQSAYIKLHRLGVAHSVESWYQGRLAGGLYGVAVSGVFSGESLFTRRDDASKCALVYLCEHLQEFSCRLIDCQFRTEFLTSLGAVDIPRSRYLELLQTGREDFIWLEGGEAR